MVETDVHRMLQDAESTQAADEVLLFLISLVASVAIEKKCHYLLKVVALHAHYNTQDSDDLRL